MTPLLPSPPPPARLRELLLPTASPAPRHDYLVGLQGTAGGAVVEVRYVPDRVVATSASVAAYFAALAPERSVEELALSILDDVNNELVPRWIRVCVTRDRPLRHWATVEDRQPGWEPPADLTLQAATMPPVLVETPSAPAETRR